MRLANMNSRIAWFNCCCMLLLATIAVIDGQRYEGDVCTFRNSNGICRKGDECDILRKAFENNQITTHDIQSCGYSVVGELVCCPTEDIFSVSTTTTTVTPDTSSTDFWLHLLTSTTTTPRTVIPTTTTTTTPAPNQSDTATERVDYWLNLLTTQPSTTTTTSRTSQVDLNPNSDYFDFSKLISGKNNKNTDELVTNDINEQTNNAQNPWISNLTNTQNINHPAQSSANNFVQPNQNKFFQNTLNANAWNAPQMSLPNNGQSFSIPNQLGFNVAAPNKFNVGVNGGFGQGNRVAFPPNTNGRNFGNANVNGGFVNFNSQFHPPNVNGRDFHNSNANGRGNGRGNNRGSHRGMSRNSWGVEPNWSSNERPHNGPAITEPWVETNFIYPQQQAAGGQSMPHGSIFPNSDGQPLASNTFEQSSSNDFTSNALNLDNDNTHSALSNFNENINSERDSLRNEVHFPQVDRNPTNVNTNTQWGVNIPSNTNPIQVTNDPISMINQKLINAGLKIVKADSNNNESNLNQVKQNFATNNVVRDTTINQVQLQQQQNQNPQAHHDPFAISQFRPEPGFNAIESTRPIPSIPDLGPPPTPTPTPSTPSDIDKRLNTERPAERACTEYYAGTSASLTPHVLNGTPVQLGEYPHMAAIGFTQIGGNRSLLYNCGGTLIHPRFVLTAAHCLVKREQKAVSVRLGVVNFLDPEEMANAVEVSIAQEHIHPDYISTKKYNDIALLELSESITYTDNIYPTCLYTSESEPEGALHVSGWGVLNNTARVTSPRLLKAKLILQPLNKCNESYTADAIPRAIDRGLIESQLCAYDPGFTKDACQGDSGGPLQMDVDESKNRYRVVGVVSAGFDCGTRTPGLYTRVYSYLKYIEDIVWPSLN